MYDGVAEAVVLAKAGVCRSSLGGGRDEWDAARLSRWYRGRCVFDGVAERVVLVEAGVCRSSLGGGRDE